MEYLLYGIRAGETERYTEELLTATPDKARVEFIKTAAGRDGWHSFRIARFTPGQKPDFIKTINL